MESHLEDDDPLEIEGYSLFRNDRDKDGGGIVVGVRNEIKNIVVEVHRSTEMYESLWVVIDNGRFKARIGVVYFPQEKTLKVKEISDIYKLIRKEIKDAREKDQSVIIAGDFNCKVVDETIKGNHPIISKGGKKLLNMVEKDDLVILNGSDKCEGLWTRDENGKKSILDYMIIEKDDEEFCRSLHVDESKTFAPFRLKKEKGMIETVYSDHNCMILKTNLLLKERDKHQMESRSFMTRENYNRFAE